MNSKSLIPLLISYLEISLFRFSVFILLRNYLFLWLFELMTDWHYSFNLFWGCGCATFSFQILCIFAPSWEIFCLIEFYLVLNLLKEPFIGCNHPFYYVLTFLFFSAFILVLPSFFWFAFKKKQLWKMSTKSLYFLSSLILKTFKVCIFSWVPT